MGNDLDLALALLRDLDGLAEVADAALNLDLLVQELLKGRDIEDLVARGLRGVDDELLGDLGALLGAGLLLFSIDLAYCFTPWSVSEAPRDWANSKAGVRCWDVLRWEPLFLSGSAEINRGCLGRKEVISCAWL